MSTGLRLSTTAVVALISAATARRPAPTSSPPSTDILSDNPGELLKPPDGVSFDDRLTRRPAPQPPVKDWCRSAVYTRSCRCCMVVQHRRSVLMRATCDTRGTRIEHCVPFPWTRETTVRPESDPLRRRWPALKLAVGT